MTLGRILIYPIKSLDGVERTSVQTTTGGALEGDRRFALFDEAGKVVNGKRTPRIQQLRTDFSDDLAEATFREDGQPTGQTFALGDSPELRSWLGEFFGFSVSLRRDDNLGFPDDTAAPGPTLTSEASLAAVGEWFGLSIEEMRRRFRTNLEVTGSEPFAEDQLFSADGSRMPFAIGPVHFLGHNPCQRCAVPGRNSRTGEPTPQFQKTFMRLRESHLPAWSARERFNHFYRFALNTSISPEDAGKFLTIGDPLSPTK
jgi:uncharacterized protein YcbX